MSVVQLSLPARARENLDYCGRCCMLQIVWGGGGGGGGGGGVVCIYTYLSAVFLLTV